MPDVRSPSVAKGMVKKVRPVLSLAEGKAAAFLTRGANAQYVSMTKGRERRWRFFQHSHIEKMRLLIYQWHRMEGKYRNHLFTSIIGTP